MIHCKRVWLCLCAVGLPVAAQAHHSWRAVYGGGEPLTVEATIVSEPFRNPHNAVHVQIENTAGEAEPWTLEWRGQRRRDGEPPVTYDLNPGDAVVVTGRRAVAANVNKIQLERLTRTADGMTIEARLDRNR
jgi:hypothetical protein